jgi:hypothetical protein
MPCKCEETLRLRLALDEDEDITAPTTVEEALAFLDALELDRWAGDVWIRKLARLRAECPLLRECVRVACRVLAAAGDPDQPRSTSASTPAPDAAQEPAAAPTKRPVASPTE